MSWSFTRLAIAAVFCSLLIADGEAQQMPQRVGAQSFQLLDTLWVDGGRHVDEDGAAMDKASDLLWAELTLNFLSSTGPILNVSSRPQDVHLVSNGFMWSNRVDRAWLFGGRPIHEDKVLNNDVWRFEMHDDGESWTRLEVAANATDGRPSHGAGCDVPDLQKGYYLGGMTMHKKEKTAESLITYHHFLAVFDMQTETLRTIPVPDFVPVVNQSIVFLNTGTRSGALVALGGFIESQGALSLADMSTVYIFDIETEQWTAQPVTDVNGQAVDENVGLRGCWIHQDKTSHNLVLMGSQNNVTALADAWVLSLPSAVWIRAQTNPEFAPNYPTAESSCILLNSRFLLMFGGCLLDVNTHKPCMSYSSAPVNYDISLLRPSDYRNSSVGYFVPEVVYKVIGGNATGFATHSKPKFLNFSSPLLEELFTPPYGVGPNGPFFYESMVSKVVIGLLSVVFSLAIALVLLHFCKPIISLPSIHQNNDWRPRVFGYGYLSFIMLSTTCLMTLVLLLQWRSQQPDTQFAHWSGGPEADGTWTGEPFTSTFIRAPTLDRPPQGLLSMYYNSSPDGVWSQKNSAQRLSRGAYFAFTYLPMILAVLYGRLWKALDDEVKRIDVYHRLQKKGGALGSRSLCVNYHVFWTPLGILQAVMYGHWSVAVSSVGSVLATIVIPVLANYLFYWELYSGAALDWPDIYSWQVALVDRGWAYILAGTLAATNLCCVVLCFMLPSLETGLSRDVRGLADLVYLLEGSEASDFALPANDADQSLADIERLFGTSRFHLQRMNGKHRIVPVQRLPNPSRLSLVKEIFPKSLHPTITKMGKWLRIIIGAIKVVSDACSEITKGVSGSGSKFLVFRRLLYLIWLLILSLLMFAQGWITASLNKNAKDTRWNYGIPIDPNVYLIVGILSQSIVDIIDHAVRCLAPFHALAQGYQRPEILWADYQSGPPIWEIWTACRDQHYLLCSSMLASLATTVFTIFLGSLQLSASSYGSTTFESDLSAATASTMLIAFVLGVHLVIGYHFSWPRGDFMPVAPAHMAAVIPYIVRSRWLREDLNDVLGPKNPNEKVKELHKLDRRYGFGKSKGGSLSYFYVERHHDSPGAIELVN